MSRRRLLYVPIAAALEVERFLAAVDWAEVASFDVPGAGARKASPPGGVAGAVAAALERLDELGWERCGVVCDSHGQAAAVELALSHPGRVEAICIGHAAAGYTHTGPRAALNPPIHDAARQLLEPDFRSVGRAVTQLTQGIADEATVDAWIAAVPQETAKHILLELSEAEPALATRLRNAEMPVVLGRHKGCVMWTEEGFADAAAALPRAHSVVCEGAPTQDPAFLAAARAVSSAGASA